MPARTGAAYLQGLREQEREVWLGGPNHNHCVDVTSTVDRKIAALRAHKSQTGHRDEIEGFVRRMLAANAETYGLPEGSYAELFQVVDTA